jgi:hypothetical protein
LVFAIGVCMCLTNTPGVYGAKLRFGIEKLGVVCIYASLNLLAVVCCGIPKVGVDHQMWFSYESSSLVRLMSLAL